MSIEAGLFAHLSAAAGVTALVGTRIYPNFQAAADTAKPYVTMQRVGQTPVNDLDGEDALQNPRVQIDCWGTTALSARAVADAVRAALVGQHAAMGAVPRVSVRRLAEFSTFDTVAQLHGVSTDYSIWHH